MNISIFGLGYVGCVSAACFADAGHQIIGVDVDANKVGMVAGGRSPVIEPGLDELIARHQQVGRLHAVTDPVEAVEKTDVSFVCVGTPSAANGSLDLSHVESVTRQIGAAMKSKDRWHVVVYRSTMLPGTARTRLIPLLEESSGKQAGRDFGVAVNPEFLREGTAIADFRSPSRTVIGELDGASGDLVAGLYDGINAPCVRLALGEAEICKYADNAFHAIKVAFANEIGTLCRLHEIDSHRVMEVFCLDTKLNLSPYYLKPGFAFGGSCLPKDVRALLHRARTLDAAAPLLEAVLPSNEAQKARALEMIVRSGKKQIGILGLSFKPGTDDLRESPIVEVIERLIGKGYDVAIYDRNVSLARLTGANKAYIEREIPHIARLMRPAVDDVLAAAELIVVANRDPEFFDVPNRLRPGMALIDLVRLPAPAGGSSQNGSYHGICW
jgi:GDP-mannose 6-dehydrogenase